MLNQSLLTTGYHQPHKSQLIHGKHTSQLPKLYPHGHQLLKNMSLKPSPKPLLYQHQQQSGLKKSLFHIQLKSGPHGLKNMLPQQSHTLPLLTKLNHQSSPTFHHSSHLKTPELNTFTLTTAQFNHQSHHQNGHHHGHQHGLHHHHKPHQPKLLPLFTITPLNMNLFHHSIQSLHTPLQLLMSPSVPYTKPLSHTGHHMLKNTLPPQSSTPTMFQPKPQFPS
jgi:hypothetical protein